MEFFIDTANVDEIRDVSSLGLVDGVTTNPSLVAKTGRDYKSIVSEICDICRGPVSAEVLSMDYEGMMKEARSWAAVAENIVVKIPLTAEGLKAVYTCSKENIKTNVTLCFSAMQALAVAKAGATYVSPFVGRLDDLGQYGMEIISDIKEIFDNYDLETKILVASIRSNLHALEAAKLGADCATIPPKILKQLLVHPLTDKGLAAFMADAEKIPLS